MLLVSLKSHLSTKNLGIAGDSIPLVPNPSSDAHIISVPNAPSQVPVALAQQRPSFRQVMSSSLHEHAPLDCDATEFSNMKPQRKGEFFSIKIDDSLVRQNVSHLQTTLIGKLSLAPSDTMYSLEGLREKLGQVWDFTGGWNLVPLGRGYFNIQLPSNENRNRLLDKRVWNLKLENLQVHHWVRGFNPYKVYKFSPGMTRPQFHN